jgi:probable addiction module antidote protein
MSNDGKPGRQPVQSTFAPSRTTRICSKIAEQTGANRQALYTALSDKCNPTLDTLLKLIVALAPRLNVAKAA